MKWRPMSTAPGDRRVIICIGSDRWPDYAPCPQPVIVAQCRRWGGGPERWSRSNAGRGYNVGFEPTGWIPMPKGIDGDMSK